jgi:hypothetical protein
MRQVFDELRLLESRRDSTRMPVRFEADIGIGRLRLPYVRNVRRVAEYGGPSL